MKYLNQIKITRVEERPNDAWFDFSLQQLREGEVCFYRVKDFLTGNWLFKVYQRKGVKQSYCESSKVSTWKTLRSTRGKYHVIPEKPN